TSIEVENDGLRHGACFDFSTRTSPCAQKQTKETKPGRRKRWAGSTHACLPNGEAAPLADIAFHLRHEMICPHSVSNAAGTPAAQPREYPIEPSRSYVTDWS